jgi:hypothetical protein
VSQKLNSAIAVIGVNIGENSFHIVGQDKRGTERSRVRRGIGVFHRSLWDFCNNQLFFAEATMQDEFPVSLSHGDNMQGGA